MKFGFAQWMACFAACATVGCNGLGWRNQAASVDGMAHAHSSGVPSISNPAFATVAHHAPVVTKPGGEQNVMLAQGIAEPAKIDVVAVDPVMSAGNISAESISAGSMVDGISLEELINLAFANNPAVKELAATTQIASGHRTQVGLYANPVVGYQGQQLAAAGIDQHMIFVQQQIITGNKLGLNRAVLNEAVRAQLQELEAQRLRVATDMKLAFYECLRIQQQLAAIEQFTGLLKQGVEVSEKRMQAGEASKIDVLQAQIQLKQLELDGNQLAVSLEAKFREIAAIAGVPGLQFRRVAGEFPEVPVIEDWRSIEDRIVATSPEYSAAQARIREANASVRRHESQTLPNVLVEFAAGVENDTNSGMMNVQVGTPLPLYNKNQGNIAAARAECARAIHEAQRIDNAIRARLAVASGDYARATEAVNMFQSDLLPAAQETLELAETAYRSGEQDFIQLLVTRRTYFDTNLAYIEARARLADAQAQIDGYLLTGALNAVVNGSGDDSLRGLTLDQE